MSNITELDPDEILAMEQAQREQNRQYQALTDEFRTALRNYERAMDARAAASAALTRAQQAYDTALAQENQAGNRINEIDARREALRPPFPYSRNGETLRNLVSVPQTDSTFRLRQGLPTRRALAPLGNPALASTVAAGEDDVDWRLVEENASGERSEDRGAGLPPY